MRRTAARVVLPLVVAALAASATAAQAAICFVIHDAKDTVVYRDWVPPFDGALDYASPEREALRQRGLHFNYFDAPVCQQVVGAIGPGGAQGRERRRNRRRHPRLPPPLARSHGRVGQRRRRVDRHGRLRPPVPVP